MSATATADPINQSGATSKSKKKKNRKKGSAAANKAEETEKANGNLSKEEAEDHEEDGEDDDEQAKPAAQTADPDDDIDDDDLPHSPTIIQTNGLSPSPPSPSDTSARLDAIAKERDALRQEVTGLRKSLENIQSKHEAAARGDDVSSKYEEEIRTLRDELDEANEGKDHFETQYKNLLGRVNTIKTSLGDRLKADAVSSPRRMACCVLKTAERIADLS
ncbi:uncharacterized protein K460DRAFT_1879 [Cucurbitaria berberidis CBS 394.84]|uniref:Uncharacterized protein n=1 Tax=Cucurbitaria berberidis CBS 394.84 TaxID=1168544 RepID=A0A9P4GQS1_9PLEO|nr:uncharacterized protein K460DRAFT_1879 [Cucurbitaria berberidis CBS 394.84]KAF1849676.1 hypothetical protein K460DRAFT_1879 [Cucurbitaria berberidis CBS 394.84]